MARGSSSAFALDDDESNVAPNKLPLTTRAYLQLGFTALLLVLNIVGAQSRSLALLNAAVSLTPALLALIVVQRIGGDGLSRAALVDQAWYGAFVGLALCTVLELALSVAGVVALFRADLARAQRWFGADLDQGMPADPALAQKLTEKMLAFLRTVSLPKMVVAVLLLAFIIAAGVEELVKWLIGRRAKSANPAPDARAFVSLVMCAGLGLAAIEHYFYSFSYIVGSGRAAGGGGAPRLLAQQQAARTWGDLALMVGASLLRAALAFPTHIGTACILGVAMAQSNVLKRPASVFGAWLKAVALHGSFDAVALLTALFIVLEMLPAWVEFVGTAVQVALCALVLALCRRHLNDLINDQGYHSVAGDAV